MIALLIVSVAILALYWITFVVAATSIGRRTYVLGAPADALLFLLGLLLLPFSVFLMSAAFVNTTRPLELTAEATGLSGLAGSCGGAVLMVLNRIVLKQWPKR